MRRFRFFKPIAPLLALAAALAGLAAVAGRWIDPEGIADLLSLTTEDVHRFAEMWGPWAALGSVALMVLHSVLPLPAEVIAVANGALFGWAGGTAVTWTGAMLGAALSFGIARRLGRPALRRFASERYRRSIERWQGRSLFLLMIRLIPVVSFNLINYAAGMTGIGWWRFLWTTGLGILPITIASVVLGDELLEAPWPVWAATGAGVAVLWLVFRRLRPRGIVTGTSVASQSRQNMVLQAALADRNRDRMSRRAQENFSAAPGRTKM